MNKGTLIRLDTPDAIKSELRGRMMAISGGSLAAIHQVLKQRWPATALVRYGDRLHFCVHRGAEEVAEALLLLKQSGIPDVVFSPIEPSLEDVFVALMSENKEEVRA